MNPSTENPQEIKAGVDLERVRASIAPALSAHGVSLVELEWKTDIAGWVLRITIEREGTRELHGGVNLDDCADVSRAVSAILDAEDLIAHNYHLEVSSPGVDRPLRTESELARFSGQIAKVKLARPAPDGQRVLRGTLNPAPEGQVAVIVDGKRIEVPFADVAEAHLVFELSSQPKGQPKKGTARPGERPAAASMGSAKGKKGAEKQKSTGRPARSS